MQNSKTLYKSRQGRICIQMLAVVVLVISISLILSAFRSLRREFDGLIIDKQLEEGLTSSYRLDLIPPFEDKREEPVKFFLKLMKGEIPHRRVGVSALVHEQSKLFQRAQKAAWSCFIYIDDERHIDLGLKWLLWGVIGIAASFAIYFQSVKNIHTQSQGLSQENLDENFDI